MSHETKYSSGECLVGDIVGIVIVAALFSEPNHPAQIGAYFLFAKAFLYDGPRYTFRILQREVPRAIKHAFHVHQEE